jgi:hypothetical protein
MLLAYKKYLTIWVSCPGYIKLRKLVDFVIFPFWMIFCLISFIFVYYRSLWRPFGKYSPPFFSYYFWMTLLYAMVFAVVMWTIFRAGIKYISPFIACVKEKMEKAEKKDKVC